jgi:predicted Kef-type K+ transport protein
LKIPPLVGYLAAGLALFAMGETASDLLHELGHIGVLLLLFTIGLHLRLRNVIRTEVLGVGVANSLLARSSSPLLGWLSA